MTFRVLTATLIGLTDFGLYQYPTNTSPNSPVGHREGWREVGRGGEGRRDVEEMGGDEEERGKWRRKREGVGRGQAMEGAVEWCMYVLECLPDNCMLHCYIM